MPANSTHADYDAALPAWIRARDLLAGEDAVKAAGAKYLPRLDGQTDEDYLAYQSRACFSNATRWAADAFVGLVFRKSPFVKIPESQDGIGKAMARFSNDADMLGTSLFGYAKSVVREVISPLRRPSDFGPWPLDVKQLALRNSWLPDFQIPSWTSAFPFRPSAPFRLWTLDFGPWTSPSHRPISALIQPLQSI